MKYYKTPACTPLPHRVGGGGVGGPRLCVGGGGGGPRHVVAEGRVSRVITENEENKLPACSPLPHRGGVLKVPLRGLCVIK